jgi:hypothetical protein
MLLSVPTYVIPGSQSTDLNYDHEIWSFHGGGDSSRDFLGCDKPEDFDTNYDHLKKSSKNNDLEIYDQACKNAAFLEDIRPEFFWTSKFQF